ncbi:glycosyltransferase [uncultured Cytophaga sp.]|uniref:glycosyltransferase n=1 Tax=uncultured Cytophaga sp. TaxID=160238 RepID=UPI002636BAAD|nr:glycosyltransferase [uncultured Cytophaga sp.]
MLIGIFFVGFFYIVFSIFLQIGWRKLPDETIDCTHKPSTTVAIILTARNEEKYLLTILEQLLHQNYPQELLQIYLADDASTDSTNDLFLKYIETYPSLFFKVELNSTYQDWKGKKKWIASAIDVIQGEFILTTDADCSIPVTWVSAMVQSYELNHKQFISGPVAMTGNRGFMRDFQKIEFLSLIGSGASAIGLEKPLMCNGANIGYARSAYKKVGGFSGNATISSGDDEFLMHKIFSMYGSKGIGFCNNKAAIIQTQPASSWSEFYNQRKRWASKWENYSLAHVQWIAIFIFIFHLIILISTVLAFIPSFTWQGAVFLWGIKGIFDYFYLKSVARFLSIGFKKSTFILSVLIYPFYVVGFGLAGRFGTYTWKERIETPHE